MMLNQSLAGLIASGAASPPLELRVDTLIFSLLIFIGLLAVLFKFAWTPIVEGLDAREKRMVDDIEAARIAKEQAEAQLTAYQEKMAGADGEASALIAEAKSTASGAKDKIMAEAAAEAEKTRERALAEIEAAKTAAVRDLAESSVNSAVSLAGSIVGRSLNESDHADLIEKSLKQFTTGA
jgi:F-type H+-transporting ATPase subunit b|tara:strand:- start:6030 stop:6572 length:543 start_codon:yes stop_codon:yes gene_type:complete